MLKTNSTVWELNCMRMKDSNVSNDRRLKTCVNTYLMRHRRWSSEHVVKSAVLMMMHVKTTFTRVFLLDIQIFVFKLWVSFDVCTKLIIICVVIIGHYNINTKKCHINHVLYAMYIISNNVNSNHYNALTVIVFIIIIINIYTHICYVCCNKPLAFRQSSRQ